MSTRWNMPWLWISFVFCGLEKMERKRSTPVMKSATRIASRCAGGLRLRLRRLLRLPRPFVFIVGTFGEPAESRSARGLRPEYRSGAVG